LKSLQTSILVKKTARSKFI